MAADGLARWEGEEESFWVEREEEDQMGESWWEEPGNYVAEKRQRSLSLGSSPAPEREAQGRRRCSPARIG